MIGRYYLSLERFSEPYSPTGNVASQGVLNQLGRPDLDILALLVRESVQNSWDARRSDTISYGIAGWMFSREQMASLRARVLKQPPRDLPLRERLVSNEMFALAIYDRGTTGLGGPTRADRVSQSESRDFVDFLRNVGQPPDKQLSGGTYGYGKAAFYLASKVSTVLVHTRCMFGGQPESRFMAAALGSPYDEGGLKYTGRHWWGQFEDKVIEPVRGLAADEIAGILGLPEIPSGELGTTIVVLAPDFGVLDPEQAMGLMAESLLWYFWPKMLDFDGAPSIMFELSLDGKPIEVPHPADFPPINGFVHAMALLKSAAAKNEGSDAIYQIQSERPRKHLGLLALERFPAEERRPLISDMEPDESISESAIQQLRRRAHHVALMRQPELVVKYLTGPELPDSRVEYAGVFISDKEVDKAFADSEPPTHDDWVAKTLPRPQKTFVNVALREINEQLREFVQPPSPRIDSVEMTPLGAFANMLGALLPGQDGPAATARPFTPEPPQMRLYEPEESATSTPSNSNGDDDFHLFSSVSLSQSVQELLGTKGPLVEGEVAAGSGIRQIDLGSIEPGTPRLFEDIDTFEMGYDHRDYEECPTADFDVPAPMPVLKRLLNESGNTSPTKAARRRGKAQIEQLDDVLIEYYGEPALQIAFKVYHATGSAGTRVKAMVSTVLDGNSLESDPPAGSVQPRILHWIDPGGRIYDGTPSIQMPLEVSGICQVVVSAPDVMVAVELRSEAVWKEGES